MLEPFKFFVQAVVIERDADGHILGERPGDVVTIYGADQLTEWAQRFEENLASATVERTTAPE